MSRWSRLFLFFVLGSSLWAQEPWVLLQGPEVVQRPEHPFPDDRPTWYYRYQLGEEKVQLWVHNLPEEPFRLVSTGPCPQSQGVVNHRGMEWVSFVWIDRWVFYCQSDLAAADFCLWLETWREAQEAWIERQGSAEYPLMNPVLF